MKLGGIIKSRLINNIINLFVLQGLSHLIPFFLIPFLINHLGLDGYGLVNFVLAFTFFFQVFNEFGFDLSNVPHVVSHRNDIKALSKIFSSIIISRLVLYFITSIVYFLIVISIPTFRYQFLIYLIGNIRILALSITPIWLFRSLEDMKSLTKIAVPIKILALLPLFFVVKNPSDVNWVMFFFMLESFLTLIVSFIVIKRFYNVQIIRVKFNDLLFYIQDSVPYFTAYLLMRIYQNGNAVILKFFGGDMIVGLYTAAEKLHNAYTGFVSPLLTQVLYPYFTRIKNLTKMNKICILVILTNTLMVGLIYIISPYLIKYFIKDSPEIITKYFCLFLIAILIDVPNNILGYSYLGVIGKIKKVTLSAMYASIIYLFGISILLIFNYVNITSLIFLLIVVQMTSTLLRIRYIRKCYRLINN